MRKEKNQTWNLHLSQKFKVNSVFVPFLSFMASCQTLNIKSRISQFSFNFISTFRLGNLKIKFQVAWNFKANYFFSAKVSKYTSKLHSFLFFILPLWFKIPLCLVLWNHVSFELQAYYFPILFQPYLYSQAQSRIIKQTP